MATYGAGSTPVSGGVPVGVPAGVPGEVLVGVPGDVPTGALAGAPGVAGPARSAGLRRRDRGRRSHAIAQIPAFTLPAVTLLFVTSPITLPYPIQDSLRPPPKRVRRRALR